jgi:hypothetical protein
MLRRKSLFLLATLGIFSINISPIFAHKVKISADIGATLHIEPNDNPRAGEVSQVWLAMTRKGGKQISLSECDCQLSVYSQPYKIGDPSLLQPNLKPLNVENYKNTPSADIKFPQAGAYYLELSGKPVSEGSFNPFQLKFDVTVATGKTTPQPTTIATIPEQKNPVNDAVAKNQKSGSLMWVMIPVGLGIFLVMLAVFKRG